MRERIAIGAHIRTLRKRAGLSQEELAHLAGVDRKQVYRIENADQSVGIDHFIRIYLALHMPLSEILKAGDRVAQGGEPLT